MAFLYIGLRAKQRKWLIWGAIYAVPFVLAVGFGYGTEAPGEATLLGDLNIALTFVMGAISVFHAFRIRKEYLVRLSSLQELKGKNDELLRRRLADEYGAETRQEKPAPDPMKREQSSVPAPVTEKSTSPAQTVSVTEGSPLTEQTRATVEPGDGPSETEPNVGRRDSGRSNRSPQQQTPPSPTIPTPVFVAADELPGRELNRRLDTGPVPAKCPIPLAYSYQLIEAEFESLRVLKETYRNAEGLTALLGSLTLALVHDPSSSIKKHLRNTWGGRGATFGGWFSILTKASRAVDEERGPLFGSTKRLLGTDKEPSTFSEDICWLMERRNELHHSDLPVGSKTENLIQEARSRLDRCISETASIWQHPLRLVLDYDALRDSDEHVLATCLDYSGDHPVGRKVQEKYRGIPKKQDLYVLQDGKEWIPLYPFISIHYCGHCHARETYFVDSWAGPGGEAGLRSLERAHEETTQEIGQALTSRLA